MKLIQLEKTKEVLFENIDDDLYFVKPVKSKTRDGGEHYNFNIQSKRVRTSTIKTIEECLNDPDCILIRIEET